MGDFFSKSPGVPGAGGFFHPESPGAPGPGDFFQPRGMPSLSGCGFYNRDAGFPWNHCLVEFDVKIRLDSGIKIIAIDVHI